MKLRIAQRAERCEVLGPGARAVIWVQGCERRCPGCIAPDKQPMDGGELLDTSGIAEWLTSLPNIHGITVSGGEPFLQAEALTELVQLVRERRPELSWLSYTGYCLEELSQAGTPEQQKFLQQLDILIDGPYVQERHTDLIWRGSDNQRVIFFNDAFRLEDEKLGLRGTWLEWEFDAQGRFFWIGIPPKGFMEKFRASLLERGVQIEFKHEHGKEAEIDER